MNLLLEGLKFRKVKNSGLPSLASVQRVFPSFVKEPEPEPKPPKVEKPKKAGPGSKRGLKPKEQKVVEYDPPADGDDK